MTGNSVALRAFVMHRSTNSGGGKEDGVARTAF
jgi:hypothetical protein